MELFGFGTVIRNFLIFYFIFYFCGFTFFYETQLLHHDVLCAAVINLGSEVGCVISEGPWVFVGINNCVKAWNTQANSELSLSGPSGQVYALAVGNEMLLAGTQDRILV